MKLLLLNDFLLVGVHFYFQFLGNPNLPFLPFYLPPPPLPSYPCVKEGILVNVFMIFSLPTYTAHARLPGLGSIHFCGQS